MKTSQTALLSALVAGCSAHTGELTPLPAEPSATTYEAARVQVQQDLQALDDLALFEVDGMVTTADMTPGICYGPCPDDAEREAAFVAQAARLHALVDLADDDTEGLGPCYTDAVSIVESSLDAIDSLDIVEVGEFLADEAEASPYCYNQPCGEDVARVEAENEARATAIWHLSERAAEL